MQTLSCVTKGREKGKRPGSSQTTAQITQSLGQRNGRWKSCLSKGLPRGRNGRCWQLHHAQTLVWGAVGEEPEAGWGAAAGGDQLTAFSAAERNTSSFLKGDPSAADLRRPRPLPSPDSVNLYKWKARHSPRLLNACLFSAWQDQVNCTVGKMQLNVVQRYTIDWQSVVGPWVTFLSAFLYVPNFRPWLFIFFLIGKDFLINF